jgi:glycosyltransferase involved in cell wall biosynthesis
LAEERECELMHIAIVANTAWYLYNFRLNLMQALMADGHTVVAIAPHDAYADRICASGAQFASVPISGRGTNPISELRTVMRLHRVLQQRRVDMVLTFTPKGNLYAGLSCIWSGRPFAANVSGLGRAFVKRTWLTRLVEVLYRLTFSRALRVFFQNNEDMEVFVTKRLVPADRAERLPGSGVDLTRFRHSVPPARPQDAPVFLLVARLLWDKGVGEFVEAARLLRARHPAARFQLLGFTDVANPSAISVAQIQDWVNEGCIEFLGSSDDVRQFMQDADCVVLPSNYREGVPRTLLEAAAMGRPVITTDAPGCRDTVIDGVSGFLCRPVDSADLADKFFRFTDLSAQERNAMGLAGRRLMESRFDEGLVINRYRALLPASAAATDVSPQQSAGRH